MVHRFRPKARWMSRAGLGLILLILLVLHTLLTGSAGAQQVTTPTTTPKNNHLPRPKATLIAPPILITESVPTYVVNDVRLLNLETTLLNNKTKKTTADLNFEDQFQATVNVESPPSMLIGESRVIMLEVVPELLAQASMVRAELHTVTFDSQDDGQPEKTVLVNTPVRWNWNIAPKAPGEQEFFLALSYINSQGSRVHWQNIVLKMTVSQPPSSTGTWTVIPSDTPVPKLDDTFTPKPTDTTIPTWTPPATYPPEVTVLPTFTPTRTFFEEVGNNLSDNPVACLGPIVTLLLGLIGVYFQYIRKGDKGSSDTK